MITKLSIENFKSFKKGEFNLKPLTLLAGINSSGKSSIIQAIRLLSCYNVDSTALEAYGGYSELRSVYADADSGIRIEVRICENACEYLAVHGDGNIKSSIGSSSSSQLLHKAQYISADRLGPQVSFNTPQARGGHTAGEYGENVVLYCLWHKDNFIDDIRKHPSSDGESFEYNIEAWMSEISPGVRLEFFHDRRTDTAAVGVGQKGDLTISQRPTNVGFGLSYTLPVVAILLGAQQGDLLLIENPEAHLHPIGQTKIGELLARTAQSGVQVIVETHSDHLIDGVRIAVRDNVLSPENSTILFCSKSLRSNLSQVEEIAFLENGELSNWPTGFCDQSLKNLSKLADF